MKKIKGVIVSFQGLDKVGKSTHAKLLANVCGASLIRFPDRSTASGRKIDSILKG